jgi:hypothetical protein
MSKREDIVAEIVTQVGNATGVQTVTREPKALEELAVPSFPHVLVETANEVRTHASIGGTPRRVSDLDVLLNINVYGANRDQSRNTIIDAIETQLDLDPTLNGNCFDCQVTEVSIREIAESAPYGQAVMVLTVRYFYERGTP